MFCERVQEEATRWERTHEDALKGKFRHRQKRSEVAWPEIPADFDEWTLPKNEKNSGKMKGTESMLFTQKRYVHDFVMYIKWSCLHKEK